MAAISKKLFHWQKKTTYGKTLKQLDVFMNFCYLDGAVPWGRHNIFIIKVNHVYSSPMSHEDAAQADVGRRGHVPDGDGAIFGACDHQAICET